MSFNTDGVVIGFGLTCIKASELFKDLSVENKIKLIQTIIGEDHGDKLETALALLGCQVEKDNQGQIVLFTDLMYAADDDDTIVPFAQLVEDDNDPNDPYEIEEEEEEEEEEIPPTLPNVAIHLTQKALVEAAQEAAKLNNPEALLFDNELQEAMTIGRDNDL